MTQNPLPHTIPDTILTHIESAMLRDRPSLGRDAVRLRAIKKPGEKEQTETLTLWSRFTQSTALADARSNAAPQHIDYPPELTITARRNEIAQTIRDNQITIIAGSTGSGKTTQLPKICLDLGRGRHGMIGITQPRRIAAISVATPASPAN